MPREIKMPKLSDTMEEGTLNVWRKSEGDAIGKGDILLEIETDKADMEFEAYMSGTLAKILVPAGETVAIGTPIAVVRLKQDSDEDVARFLAERGLDAAAPRPVASEPVAVASPSEAPAAPAPASLAPATLPPPASELPFFVPDPDRVRATPRARVLARDQGVDLSEIAGSGPEGAVLVRDVELYLEALDASDESSAPGDVLATPVAQRLADEQHVDLTRVKGTGPGGRVTKRDIREHLEREAREGPERTARLIGDEIKLSQKRKFLIRNMVESKQSTPHFYIAMEVDADPLAVLRRRLKKEGRRITYTHMIMKASALALERFPEANATFRDNRILRYQPINIAVAVDVQDELVAPVVKDRRADPQGARAQARARGLLRRHLHRLQPRHAGRGPLLRDHHPAAEHGALRGSAADGSRRRRRGPDDPGGSPHGLRVGLRPSRPRRRPGGAVPGRAGPAARESRRAAREQREARCVSSPSTGWGRSRTRRASSSR
jgi:pyruvate dehydrogenase E2 component (dihydrolipoamide acetyltransferase)